MRTEAELMAAANETFVASYRKLVEHCRDGDVHEVGGVFAFATGISLSLFNGCIAVAPATSTQLEEAMDWLARRGLPHRVWIDESIRPGLGDVLRGLGFQRDERAYPNMVLHPIPLLPAPPVAVTLVPVTATELDEFLAVSIEGGMPADAARLLFSASFAADPDVRLFAGRLDGRAVGTAVAIRSGDVSGIYAVGTSPPARRHGVGTALTWAAVGAGRAWGCHTIALQASEMGYPIYAAMGFRTVVSYGEYARPAPPA